MLADDVEGAFSREARDVRDRLRVLLNGVPAVGGKGDEGTERVEEEAEEEIKRKEGK